VPLQEVVAMRDAAGAPASPLPPLTWAQQDVAASAVGRAVLMAFILRDVRLR
jgi:hypothetical protein